MPHTARIRSCRLVLSCTAVLIGAVLTAPFPAAFAQDAGAHTYHFDPEHTDISFEIQYIGIVPVRGTFTEYTGAFTFDDGDLSKAALDVVIQAASIDTEVARRDRHLRSSDFFDVETYPEITFRSTRFEARDGHYAVTGPLTMHGVTREITIPFTLTGELLYPNTDGILRGTEAQITLNRTDYGIGSQQAFLQVMKNGSAWASEEVEITLNAMWERNIPRVADLLAETIEQDGIDAAVAQYRALKAGYLDKPVYSFGTNYFSRLASRLLEAGQTREAVEIYKINVDLQPEWPWVYPPLAEAYLHHGDTTAAVAAYRQALHLNPDDADTAATLRTLTGQE